MLTTHTYNTTVTLYTFIPRMPTKAAWDSRPFQGFHSLQAMVEQLKTKKEMKHTFKGQAFLREEDPVLGHGLPKTLTFSGITDLEIILSSYRWDATKFRKIYFLQHGYIEIPEPKKSP